MVYHATFFDHSDRIFGHDTFEAGNDDAAIEHARRRYQAGIGKGYHLHRAEHHVHTHMHGETPSVPDPLK